MGSWVLILGTLCHLQSFIILLGVRELLLRSLVSIVLLDAAEF